MSPRNKIIACVCVLAFLVIAVKSCSSDDEPTAQAIMQSNAQQQVQVERRAIQQPAPVQEVQPVYDQPQPNVVVVQQPPQQATGGITTDHLMAGALGYMAGRSSNSGYNNRRPTVINRTIIQRQVVRPSRSYYGSSSFSSKRSFGSSRSSSRRR